MKFGDILEMADAEAFIHPDGKKVPAVVHSAVYKKSSNGNDMLAMQFRVTGGPNAGKGRPIRHYILFNDRGRQQISNLGFPAKDFAALSNLEAEDALGKIAAVVSGKPCAVDIKSEPYQGRPQNKIDWVHPASAAAKGPSAAKVKEIQPEYEPDPGDAQEEEESELARLERELEEARAAAKPKSTRTKPPSDLPF